MTVGAVAKGQEGREGGVLAGERGWDLQTNLITSLQNGITLLVLEWLTFQKARAKEQESSILKREKAGMERGRCWIKGL